MQGRQKFLQLFLVALIVSLMLGGCGGGTTGATWFNLPSIPVRIQPDGTAKVFGIGLGAILPPAMLQQLQGANVQKLEVRIGYNGVHAYANGQDLPYLEWSQEQVDSLMGILQKMPQTSAMSGQIAQGLTWARKIGLGATLNIPAANGQTPVTVPAWTGETTVASEAAPATPTIGPLNLSGIALDPSGGISIAGMPLSDLGVAAGVPPAVTDIFKQIGAEKLGIKTNPNGIDLSLNDIKLPSLKYDTASLGAVTGLLPALGLPANVVDMVTQIAPKLPGAAIDVNVSTTGQPVGGIELGTIPLQVGEDGSLSAFGLPLGAGLLPADLLKQFSSAGVNQLAVNVNGSEIALAANGQVLPTISYDQASLGPLLKVAEGFGVPSKTINGALDLVNKLTGDKPLDLKLNLPGGSGDVPAIDKTMQAPTLPEGMSAPSIHLTTAFAADGSLQAIGDLTTQELSGMGVPLAFSLPANVVSALGQSGASSLGIKSEANKLNIQLDGKNALTIGFDAASLKGALALAKPFLAGTLLEDPAISKLIEDQILPLAPSADLDVQVNLK